MVNLFETMMQAQNGAASELMAKQFNLSRQQTELAVEALMPAFATAFRRNASDPMGMAGFMQALASGNHMKYFEDMSRAFQPQGIEEGNGILGHIFGSKEVSRAVAAQASAATGIGQEIFKQMMPVMASALMGGLFKQSTQPQAFGAANGNIIGQVIEQMMRQGQQYTQPRETAPRNPNPMDNPFGRVLEEMFGGGASRQREPEPQQRQPNPMNPMDNPLGRIFEEMMRGGGAPRRAPEPEPEPAPRSNPSGRNRNPYDDLFGDMFEAGRKTRDTYQESMESIFDQYLKGMQRHR